MRGAAPRCPRLGLIVVLLLFGTGRNVGAAGLRDVDDGWLLAPGEVHLLLSGLPSPAADCSPAGAWVAAGRMRLFGLPELETTSLAAGLGARISSLPWRVNVSGQRTGGGLVQEDYLEGFLAFGGTTAIGPVVRRSRLAIGRKRESSAWEIGLRVGHVLEPREHLRCTLQWNGRFTARPDWHGNQGLHRAARAALVDAAAGLALAVALDRRGDGQPFLMIEGCARLEEPCAVGILVDPATGALGPQTIWRRGGLLIRSSHVVHPALGVTHRFVLVAGKWSGAAW